MLRVDKALFSNVVTAVQRTANLPGGAVRNLPGGASLEGMKGVESFSAEVADAKKEFELGRVHNSLARIRQIEMQFNSIAGRWNAQAGGILASARQGKQAVPAQKLNEVKNAQAKMRQLTAPATKSFRDLITALEHAVASRNDAEEASDQASEQRTSSTDLVSTSAIASGSPTGPAVSNEKPLDDEEESVASRSFDSEPRKEVPDLAVLGKFAEKYRFGPKLEVKISESRKRHISPKLEEGRFYFVQGMQPPTVVRVREIRSSAVLVYDALHGNETLLDSFRLRTLIGRGIWLLTPSRIGA
ncbi:hypothetical protein [Neorhodopirellula pilleata]|uniref:Uncharacterized protein n=1 Tax=Neorhodopirellula pilleata TaxID=2714738 RepID=A0A5C6A800_9BACT|nr:hypothetical protein [Neorhodopirellula pilleata]TWT95517.1 hypothetical protein Pla100_31580 [Neorhodopirellula pilleata]